MNEPCLKLTAYFDERQRATAAGARTAFLADSMLDLFDRNDVAASVMLRGIAGFGPRHVLRTDESLSLSEDPPVAVAAVDLESKISGLVDSVLTMTRRGLVTLERARVVDIGDNATGSDMVKLTVYIGRRERVGRQLAHRGVCDVLRRHQFGYGAVFLGVDGTMHGHRYRASFVSRNVSVPLMIVAVGTPSQASAAIADLKTLAPQAVLTVERVRLCKQGGRMLDRPHELPPTDDHGHPLWQKLTVLSSEAITRDGVPVHRALVRRLRDSDSARGATALRGVWGFDRDQKPLGDRLFRLTRDVPVATVIVDTSERVARIFEMVDRVTAEHATVLSEVVPAATLVDGPDRDGGTALAGHPG